MIPLSYRKYLTSAYEYYQDRTLEQIEMSMPRLHGEKKVVSKVCKGDERMAAIRKTLNELGYERSKLQRQFHDKFIQAVALHLYKDDPDVDLEQIMRINNWTDLRQSVLCLTPRRFGKTTAVALFIAAYAMCVPHSTQSVFSTGRRASQKLLELIRDIIKKTHMASYIVKCNQEELTLQIGFDRRRIFSFPSSPKTLRGVGGDVLYLEEAAFIDLQVFYEIVVPLLEMDTTALIAISTPQDKQNFYSEMFELKDARGEPFFRTIKVSLICEKCQAAGKGSSCTHNLDLIPPWKSAGKLEMVRALYGDQKDLMARESMGAITQDANSVFDMQQIEMIMQMKHFDGEPNFFFTAVDPCGGGTSYMAVVSLVLQGDRTYIVGMDASPADGTEEIRALLIQHIRGVRSILGNAWCIALFESNLGQEAQHMKHMVKDERLVYVVHEKKKAGVNTTHKRKELYAKTLVESIAELKFSPKCICANPKIDAQTRMQKTKAEFKKQMIEFKKLTIPAAKPFDLPKIIYTGKTKKGKNDDIVMTLMIGLFWAREFLTKNIPNIPYDKLR